MIGWRLLDKIIKGSLRRCNLSGGQNELKAAPPNISKGKEGIPPAGRPVSAKVLRKVFS